MTLTYWAWLNDLQSVCDIWNAKHPNIQVQAVFGLPGNNGGYEKMYSALDTGGGPDIGQVELRSVPEFMLVGGLVDLARYGANDYAHLYNPADWAQVTFNGGVYAIPQDSGPMGFFYQPAVLAKIGAAPPRSWDEWAEVAREIRKENRANYLESVSVSDPSWFIALAEQAGAAWFRETPDGWVITMDDEPTLAVARFFDQAIDADLVSTAFDPYSAGWTAAAANGQIGAVTSASWGDALIETIGNGAGRWKVAPMQRWPSGYGSSALGGSTAAVLANSKHPQEAMEFAVWMTTSREGIDAMIKYCGVGWSPARDYIGAQRQAPSQFFSGQNYNTEVFLPASREQNPNWLWWPIVQRTIFTIADGFQRKLTSGQSLVDTMHQAQQQTVATFRHIGLTVRDSA